MARCAAAGTTRGTSSTRRSTRPRSRTSATRCGSARPTGATSPACRSPVSSPGASSATSTPAPRSPRGSASASSASARASTSTCPSRRALPSASARRCPAARRSSQGFPRMAEEIDEEHENGNGVAAPGLGGLRRRGIYLLPNLFTTGVLFCGFYAIVQAMNGFFEVAAVTVYVAMVLDGMDGRVARWTRTQSEFGAQYDSIADMVAFGAAPALIAYVWALQDYGKLGWIGAFVYCAGAGIRLARFNVNIGSVDKRFFQGLPSPSGAALLVGFVWVLTDYGFDP